MVARNVERTFRPQPRSLFFSAWNKRSWCRVLACAPPNPKLGDLSPTKGSKDEEKYRDDGIALSHSRLRRRCRRAGNDHLSGQGTIGRSAIEGPSRVRAVG